MQHLRHLGDHFLLRWFRSEVRVLGWVGFVAVEFSADILVFVVRPLGVAPTVRANGSAHDIPLAGAEVLAERGGLPRLVGFDSSGAKLVPSR